jgi:hypothetical protein
MTETIFDKVTKAANERKNDTMLLVTLLSILLQKGFSGKLTIQESEVTEMAGHFSSGKFKRSVKIDKQNKTITLEIKESTT